MDGIIACMQNSASFFVDACIAHMVKYHGNLELLCKGGLWLTCGSLPCLQDNVFVTLVVSVQYQVQKEVGGQQGSSFLGYVYNLMCCRPDRTFSIVAASMHPYSIPAV